MKYVKADWDPRLPGFHVDPGEYLEQLPRLSGDLPPGARKFATDADHYNFRSARCVKDLELSNVHVPVGRNESMSIRFAPNAWKHEEGLRIEYVGVAYFSMESHREIDWTEAETVILDEIIPTQDGCVHEIALTDATVLVRCSDLRATWGDG